MPKPQYSGDHLRVRAALVAVYVPGVTRCAIGNEILTAPPRLLDLAHETDELGRPTGRWSGLSCRPHNRGANAWGKLRRKAAADAARPPERVREKSDQESRRTAKSARREFDLAQRMIAADAVVADDDTDDAGRDWLPYPFTSARHTATATRVAFVTCVGVRSGCSVMIRAISVFAAQRDGDLGALLPLLPLHPASVSSRHAASTAPPRANTAPG